MAVHDFDMARFLAGSEVTEVYCKGSCKVRERKRRAREREKHTHTHTQRKTEREAGGEIRKNPLVFLFLMPSDF